MGFGLKSNPASSWITSPPSLYNLMTKLTSATTYNLRLAVSAASVSHVISVLLIAETTHLAFPFNVRVNQYLGSRVAGKFSPVIVRILPPARLREDFGEMSVITISISSSKTTELSILIRPYSSITQGSHLPAGTGVAKVQDINVSVLGAFSVSITHSTFPISTLTISNGRLVPVIVTAKVSTVKAVIKLSCSKYSKPQVKFLHKAGNSSIVTMTQGYSSIVQKYSGGTTGQIMLSPYGLNSD